MPYPSRIKVFILKIFGAKVGENIVIKPNVNIKYPWFLKLEIMYELEKVSGLIILPQ